MSRSVDRALTLLEAIALSRTPPSGPELARAAGVNRSTTWQLLATLEHHQLVDRDPMTGRYTVGLGALTLMSNLNYASLVRRGRPILERLSQQTGEATELIVALAMNTVVVDQVDVAQVVSIDWSGRQLPLHCSASGKLLLASFSDSDLDVFLSRPLEARTEKTITDRDGLLREITEARRTGIATNFGEYEVGLNGFSAAARAESGAPIAFITVSGPEFRLPANRLDDVAPLLLAAADELTATLKLP